MPAPPLNYGGTACAAMIYDPFCEPGHVLPRPGSVNKADDEGKQEGDPESPGHQ